VFIFTGIIMIIVVVIDSVK